MSVLLIEDDYCTREILAGVLKSSGLSVTAIDSGEEAFELFEQGFSYELLMTDIRLRGRYDGWSVAVEARRYNPLISVIYTTATHQQKSPVTRSVYLRKPVRPKLLLEVVGTLLNRSLRLPPDLPVPLYEVGIGSANYLH